MEAMVILFAVTMSLYVGWFLLIIVVACTTAGPRTGGRSAETELQSKQLTVIITHLHEGFNTL